MWNKLMEYAQQHIPNVIQFALQVVLSLIVFLIGMKLIKWIRKIVRRSLEKAGADMGIKQFMDSLLKFLLYFLLVFIIGTKFGLDATSVAAVLASAGVAIGLALQGSLSNLAGGVLILLLKPFVVGDYIIEDTNKQEGTVAEIQIFYTKLKTVDNKIIVIPNGALANNSLTNVTAQNERRLDISVNVSYKADLKKTKGLIEKLLKEDACIKKDKECVVFVSELGQDAVVIGARGWVAAEDYWTTKWRVLENVKTILEENGVEIPYRQIDVHMKEQ